MTAIAARAVFRPERDGSTAMATPKRKRHPLPPTTTFRAAADRYVAQGGSERGLDRIVQHFGPDITIWEIDETAISHAVHALGGHLSESGAHSMIRSITVILNHAFDTGRRRGPGKTPPR